jgi:malonate transporter and related proteins
MSIAAVLSALVPVFLLIIAGILARRLLVTDDAHWIGVERLIYYLLFPALLIATLARADLTRVPVEIVGGVLFAAVLIMALILLLLRPLLGSALGIEGPAFTSVFQGATRWQTFIALAVAGNLYGDYGLALASVAAVAMIPLLNVICVWVLARFAAPKPPRWPQVLIAIAKNPLIWSCAIGIALNLTRAPIPAPAFAFADAMGRAALPLGLLLVGAGLQLDALVRPAPATLISAALKLVVMPAIAIGLARAVGATGAPLAVIACCAAVPSASGAYVLARQMGGDTRLMSAILTLETILAIITMPAAIELALQ